MRPFVLALLLLSASVGLPTAAHKVSHKGLPAEFNGDITLNGDISLGERFSVRDPQNGGYYRPVQPIPYQRKCGTISTDVCEVPVNVPPGASGEQLYQMYKQAQAANRKGEALGYLHQSAEMGYALGEGAYGYALLTGEGAMFDPQNGVAWLEKSAAQGNRGAQVGLAITYEDGQNGIPRDQAKAVDYLKEAAAQHQSEAEYRLGVDYEVGRGVTRDRALAIQWLRRAAADGAPNASATATVLAKSATPRFSSVDELNSYVFPAPAPVHLADGACGAIPVLNTTTREVNGFVINQKGVWCAFHARGCPYYDSIGYVKRYC